MKDESETQGPSFVTRHMRGVSQRDRTALVFLPDVETFAALAREVDRSGEDGPGAAKRIRLAAEVLEKSSTLHHPQVAFCALTGDTSEQLEAAVGLAELAMQHFRDMTGQPSSYELGDLLYINQKLLAARDIYRGSLGQVPEAAQLQTNNGVVPRFSAN